MYIYICICPHFFVAWDTMFLFHFFGGRDSLRLGLRLVAENVVAGLGQGLQIAFPLCGESLLHQHRVVQGARCLKTQREGPSWISLDQKLDT